MNVRMNSSTAVKQNAPWGAVVLGVCFLLFSHCHENETTAPAESLDPAGVFLSFSECKTAGAKAVMDTMDSARDSVEYSFSGNTLSFRHVNTAFNCCVESIYADFEFSGDTIRVREIEELLNPGGCRCTCLNDVTWEIRNLDAGEYLIEVEQLYLEAECERHRFTVDLVDSPTGNGEIVRDHYPWGEPFPEPAIELFYFSKCKGDDKENSALADTISGDCLLYSYDGSSLLSLTHINTAFNCCPDSFPVTISLSGDTLRIVENEMLDQGGCNCLCLYDLEYRVSDLPPGSYQLEIGQMYLGDGGETHHITLELSGAVSGNHCIARSHYPWQ